MLPIAQGSALGERRPRLIHSAFLRQRKNATRRKRVTHYALNATRGVAPHKAGCSYRARHFNQCNIVPPGRCPGLSAAIGLTARHTCAANAVKSCIYMNVLLLKNWFVFNRRFLDIFGCTRHSPNKFGSALACTKIGGGSA